MPKLVLAKTFLPDYANLEKSVRLKVDEVFTKFLDSTHSGLHLEKYSGQRDPRARTIRIDIHYRGIVAAPESGDAYILTRVLTHDEADRWMARNTFGVNEVTGALEVADEVGFLAASETLQASPVTTTPSLFEGRSAKDFTSLGVDAAIIPLLDRVQSIEELDGLTKFMPEGQADALHMLASGYSVEDAWAELVAAEKPADIDTDDLAAAAERPSSQSMFYVVQADEELADMLNRPFELWRTFLHPTQRRFAYKSVFKGSARVTGGAGTGKTVIAMHRARFLAEQASEDRNAKVLFTTYTTSLANELHATMQTFCDPDVFKRIDVVNVDRLSHRIVSDEEGRKLQIAQSDECRSIWEDTVDELGVPYPWEFLNQEWEQIVLGQRITARADYFTAPRVGRGTRLSRRDRAEVWRAIEAFTNRLISTNQRTYLQMADGAASYLDARTVKPYSHVIVDEAQDLHPAQWRMLRAAVAPGENDLFLVGDTHQRIYDSRVSLSKLGIEVRGRSSRLRINYRTTYEILKWSLALLTGESFDDMDGGAETLAGYRSTFHGPEPIFEGYRSRQDEIAGLVTAVRGWIDSGLEPGSIGIAARTKEVLGDVEKALVSAGIPAAQLADNKATDKVAIGTMHRMKGMEFRVVSIVDAGEKKVPFMQFVTQKSVDELQHQYDLQRERCLMYVACTRARDTLRVSWTGKPSPFIDATT